MPKKVGRPNLTPEEIQKRNTESKRSQREFMAEHQPNLNHERILDSRESFKSWYERGSEKYPRNFDTNEYPRRAEQLRYKELNKERLRKKEAEWRDRNREYINFRARAYTKGLFVTKKLWDSFQKLTPQEQEEVYKINPEAPAILRPKGLVLRRVIRPRQTVTEE